ncbi:MAG: carboxypeptidase-like regulatory domain-containing protein [Chryseolinea sp.]
MLKPVPYTFILAAIITSVLTEAYAQRIDVNLTGIVYDSLTRLPLEYVSVLNQTAGTGATTDENGSFKLKVSPGDSILFTMLGYSQKTRIIRPHELTVIVFLREFALTLNPVTIYGSFKPQGSERWQSVIKVPKIFRNPAGPGSGYVMETFGLGVVITGLLSKMLNVEKEKKKLNAMRERSKQSTTYMTMIVSDETKAFFQNTFSMSEVEYEKFIESFNKAHPEAVYFQSRDDILNLMVAHLATKE